ncbi:MAG: NAD(+)/NADH kinase [Phototrophicales bacterium]|nr:NAD(+)/NADH kinase [Phototrophicales bacterium]
MATPLRCIGVLAHPLRPQTYPIAEQLQTAILGRGIETWGYTSWKPEDVINDIPRADLVIAIGGDGAMLRSARVCAEHGVPILGINMGQLGFLTEITDYTQWQNHLETVLKGDYWIETRAMIRAQVFRDDQLIAESDALNDVVISGSTVGRMIRLKTYVDNDWLTTYHADALVIATATGSTAYALALGGPILPPELKNILIMPSAPHLSMERPIVLADGARVEVHPTAINDHNMLISLDGQILCHLESDDKIHVQVSENASQFVRLRGRNYFYRALLDRLEPRIGRSEQEKDLEG